MAFVEIKQTEEPIKNFGRESIVLVVADVADSSLQKEFIYVTYINETDLIKNMICVRIV